MSRRLGEIARRKESLIARCVRERDDLSAAVSRLRRSFDLGTLISGLRQNLKTHPIILAGISCLAASGYAGKLLRTAGAGFKLWRLFRPIWLWWKKAR